MIILFDGIFNIDPYLSVFGSSWFGITVFGSAYLGGGTVFGSAYFADSIFGNAYGGRSLFGNRNDYLFYNVQYNLYYIVWISVSCECYA